MQSPEPRLIEGETSEALAGIFPEAQGLQRRGSDTNCKYSSSMCSTCTRSARNIRSKVCGQGGCWTGMAGTHIRIDCNAFGQKLALFTDQGYWLEDHVMVYVDDILKCGCKKCGSTNRHDGPGRVTINSVSCCCGAGSEALERNGGDQAFSIRECGDDEPL